MKRIVSSVPGRLRLRDPALRCALRLDRLRGALATIAGIGAVEANLSAGSLVVRYDPARLTREAVEARIEAVAAKVLDSEPRPPAGERHAGTLRVRANRAAKRGMLGSLAASLLLVAMGHRRWHAFSGGLFLAFLAIHLAAHHRRLLR